MTVRPIAFTLIAASCSWPAAAQMPDTAAFSSMAWRGIGPYRGGRSVAVTGVGTDPLTYYFGGVGSGVWKTTDAGTTWRNISDATFGTSSVGAIAVAPSDPNVVYVGMGEHAVRGVMTSHGDGVYRSTDAGRTWSHVGLDRTRAIARIQVHPRDPDLVYVAAQGAPYGPTDDRGVYRSRDGGGAWERILSTTETGGASDLSMDPSNPRILYAAFWDHLRQGWTVNSGGPGSGLFKSTDGGDSWERLSADLPALMGKTSIAVSANPDRVYAMIEADPGGGLFRSDNGGRSWQLMNASWTLRARAWYYIEVFADPQNPDVVWVLGAPAMKSIDGGRTFTRVATPHGDNHDMWINPTNSNFVINANDGGANVSLNGGETWSTQQNQNTAQFYRVNVDHQYPYWVYGGQQDNSSVAIVSQTAAGGITWKDWYASAGCESAYIAMNRDDPRYQYGGCYMGQIAEYDRETGTNRNIMAYPHLPAALASRDMKYRFNWNAPIVVSAHDPDVLYHAAQLVLVSRDRGNTWAEISPDLTRNEDAKQGPGGGPITNEGAGGEIYNTIMYLSESPLDPQLLWVGSDDGLVHVTRDGGSTWQNVTPREMDEGIVNAIDASPHEAGVAYVAFTRYKFNDFTPHVFKTDNFGERWERVTDGLAPEAHVRVVREDPVRRGLLYAGTEAGVYVSWDDGDRWQSLQRNLPLTPITDLVIQEPDNDLVASTQGRGFWILDDLTPLQAWGAQDAQADLHLYPPRDAVRMAGGGGFGGFGGIRGQNPPAGAIVDYVVRAVSDTLPVTVEILDERQEVIRAYSSAGERDDGVDSLEVHAGHNRLAWNLRHADVPTVAGSYVFGSLAGRRAIPGVYQVRVTQGDRSDTQSFRVVKDPRIDATTADFIAQDRMMVALTQHLVEITESIVALRSVESQVDALMQRTEDHSAAAEIETAGLALRERVVEVGDSLIQRRTVDGQTVINFPSRLRFHYIYLRGAVDGAEGGVTSGARTMFEDLQLTWARHQVVVNDLLGAELDAFNQLVASHGVPAIVTADRRPIP